ncbi:hypothetical protein DPMN_107804 [Dreissena polymorpha]|uniref:Uncharacterized protein n=1 Tax=Dreissena polymorpha TaxID=45954 RepID=A0A9D4K7U7_DREPO|nr:hypothetical protein DPMN_107804 [Dreissena polymorpha]
MNDIVMARTSLFRPPASQLADLDLGDIYVILLHDTPYYDVAYEEGLVPAYSMPGVVVVYVDRRGCRISSLRGGTRAGIQPKSR